MKIRFIYKYIRNSILIGSLLLIIAACQKFDFPVDNSYSRAFHPPTFAANDVGATSVSLNWPTVSGTDMYIVEVSRDSLLFETIVYKLEIKADTLPTGTTSITWNLKNLFGNTNHSARVKTTSLSGAPDSKYITVFFKTGVEQIMSNVSSNDIIDNAAYLRWKPGSEVTHLLLKAPGVDPLRVELTDADKAAGMKYVQGLTPGTSYTAEIYNTDNNRRGFVTFSTKSNVSGTIVDLRNVTFRSTLLFDTLSTVPSGSTILLKRGMTYTIPSTYIFSKTVTIMSGMGFEPLANISLAGNFDATGSIDSLKFIDLVISRTTSNYFMNVGNIASIGLLSFENCQTVGNFPNSFVRLKTAGDLISKLSIKNCVIDSFGVGASYALIYASASNNAKIDKIEVLNSTFYYFYYFLRQDGVTTSSVTINNCTFNDMVQNNGYFINYTTFPPITISNSILGKVTDPTKSNGIKASAAAVLTNTYATSDCVFSANPITGATPYANASTVLFKDSAHGDFTIIDNGFAGKSTAGDPRWRP